MIWVRLATEAFCWSSWAWQNRGHLEPVLKRAGNLGEFAQAAIANPDGALRRVGNTLVFGRADGGAQVLGFIEQTGPQIEAIHAAVTDVQMSQQALQLGQQALSASLSSLQTLAMVSLGFTAILPLVLHAQFRALGRRLTEMQKDLKAIRRSVQMMNVANLETGLVHLQLGVAPEGDSRQDARDYLKRAHDRCLEALKYFGGLLDAELDETKVNRDEVRLLFRYFTVAIGGVVGSHVGLEEDVNATAKISEVGAKLRRVAQWVFVETVAKDPARFLLTPVDQGGASLAFLVDLFRQARDAGAVDSQQDYSASTWFEEHRRKLFQARRPWLGQRKWRAAMRTDLLEATAVLEEVNRIKGLETLLLEVRSKGQHGTEIQSKVQEITRTQSRSSPYIVWALT